jgi:predicted alpha/beta hydrolase family esterase
LKAKLITVENGGHFIAQEGFIEFPLVHDELCNMMTKF